VPPAEPDRLTTEGHELACSLLKETREELLRADGKAQILFAVSGVVIGVVLGGILAGDWKPSDLACGAAIVWWSGVGAAGVGLCSLLYGICPRLYPSKNERIFYFEDVREKKREELVRGLNLEAGHKERDAEQLIALSKVAHTKYVAVRVAVAALIIAAVLCLGAVLLG
jgi:hypothetical protein